jgi:adenylate cyclase
VVWGADFVKAHASYFPTPRTGLVEFQPDDDGIARAYPLPGSLVAAALDAPPPEPGGLLRWLGGLEQIRTLDVPVLSAAPFIAAGEPGLRQLLAAAPDLELEPMARALAALPPFPPEFTAQVRGRVVFVGANASSTFDVKALPVGKVESGVLLHWTAWANHTAGGFITAVPRAAVLLVALLGALAIGWAGRSHAALRGPLLMTGGLVLGLLGGAYALLSAGWFLPPATPVAAALLALLGVVAESFWREQARKREIQAMFGAYVDPAVVAALVRHPDAIRLGGERRAATVFFLRPRGFHRVVRAAPRRARKDGRGRQRLPGGDQRVPAPPRRLCGQIHR